MLYFLLVTKSLQIHKSFLSLEFEIKYVYVIVHPFTQNVDYHNILVQFDRRGKFDKFGKLSMICLTKAIQSSACNQ